MGNNWGNANWNQRKKPPQQPPKQPIAQNRQAQHNRGQQGQDPSLGQPQQGQETTGSANKPNPIVNPDKVQSTQPAVDPSGQSPTINDVTQNPTGSTHQPTLADEVVNIEAPKLADASKINFNDPMGGDLSQPIADPLATPDNLGGSIDSLQKGAAQAGGETIDTKGMAPAGHDPSSLASRREAYDARMEARRQENLQRFKESGRESRADNFWHRGNRFGDNIAAQSGGHPPQASQAPQGGGGGGGGNSLGGQAAQRAGGGNPMGQFASRGHYLAARQRAAMNKFNRGGFSGNVGFATPHHLSWRMHPNARPFRRI